MDQRQAVLAALMENPQLAESLPHAELYSLRGMAPPQMQNTLAPYEHQAFAREATAENPLLALPIAVGTPAYQVYKAMFGARSDPSLQQIGAGWKGVAQGLRNAFAR